MFAAAAVVVVGVVDDVEVAVCETEVALGS